ncbi:MAG: hypothetical protein U9O94_03860, partial [Nanoarchaeota archaeon]|nr:hypothetical protein [Nanoarchaeota archaeon]
NSRKAVACALCARYLKRISSHLRAIASTVVNPFDKVGYSLDHISLLEKKNVPVWKLRKAT